MTTEILELKQMILDLSQQGLHPIGIDAMRAMLTDAVSSIGGAHPAAPAEEVPVEPSAPAIEFETPTQMSGQVQTFAWADPNAKCKSRKGIKFRLLPEDYKFPRKVRLHTVYKMFYSPHSLGSSGIIVGSLDNVKPCKDIKNKLERDYYYKAKAVVAIMDKFLSAVPQSAAELANFRRLRHRRDEGLKQKAAELLDKLSMRAHKLFIEKISDATGIKVPFSVAVQTASKYLPRYRAATGEASSSANGESRSRKRQRTRSSLFSSLFSTESVAV